MKDYIEQAVRTESKPDPQMSMRVVASIRLLHGAMGLETEVGEFMDALKKHIFYGKPLDLTNLKEEIGDILWYIAILLDHLGGSFEEEMERNIAKLKARYPDKYEHEKALDRDLLTERTVLETRPDMNDY